MMKTTTHFHEKNSSSYSLSMLHSHQGLNVFKSCLVKEGFKKLLFLIDTAQLQFFQRQIWRNGRISQNLLETVPEKSSP